jgi:hypothetical protein
MKSQRQLIDAGHGQLAGRELDDLPSVLPAGTKYATTQDRLDQIALRKAGFNNRFAPYPQP